MNPPSSSSQSQVIPQSNIFEGMTMRNPQQQIEQSQVTKPNIFEGMTMRNPQQQHFSSGGSVSSDYDPYLNTYNYGSPLSPAEYMDNQMPDSRYDTQGQASLPYHQQQNQYQSQSFPVFKHKAHGSSISDRDALRRLAAKNLGITPSMRGCFLR